MLMVCSDSDDDDVNHQNNEAVQYDDMISLPPTEYFGDNEDYLDTDDVALDIVSERTFRNRNHNDASNNNSNRNVRKRMREEMNEYGEQKTLSPSPAISRKKQKTSELTIDGQRNQHLHGDENSIKFTMPALNMRAANTSMSEMDYDVEGFGDNMAWEATGLEGNGEEEDVDLDVENRIEIDRLHENKEDLTLVLRSLFTPEVVCKCMIPKHKIDPIQNKSVIEHVRCGLQ